MNKDDVSYPEFAEISITIFGLDEALSCVYNRRHCSTSLQSSSGDLATGSHGFDACVSTPNGITRWRFPRANGALIPAGNCWEKIGSISGCLWSLSQTPFSLPKQAPGATGLKKLCCSSRKPVGNDWDKAGAVNQT
jgi:hypothetical protein